MVAVRRIILSESFFRSVKYGRRIISRDSIPFNYGKFARRLHALFICMLTCLVAL